MPAVDCAPAVVREAELHEILLFLTSQNNKREYLPEYLEPVLDSINVQVLLRKRLFRKTRKGFIAFIGKKAVGYCVANYLEEETILDLLYVDESFRKCGIAKELIKVSEVGSVVVNVANTNAINLYNQMGLKIDLDD